VANHQARGNRANLAVPWKKGQSGNPRGRPKGVAEFATRMRVAFEEADPKKKRSLADVVLGIAFDDDNPKQMDAIKFAAAYGLGLPKRALDDETVKKLATEMMEAALEEARKRRSQQPAIAPDGEQKQEDWTANGARVP